LSFANMSRITKLYARLASLEEEYLRLIRDEFQGHADGDSTAWLGRFPSHRKKPAPIDPTKVQRIDKLEHEILAVRRTLGEPVPGQSVAIPQEFRREFDALGVFQTGGNWIRLAREALARIDAVQTAERQKNET
jgi:hypothetical protein